MTIEHRQRGSEGRRTHLVSKLLTTLHYHAASFAQKGNYPSAERLLKKIVASSATPIDALLLLGKVYYQQGRTTEAEKTLKTVLQLDPANTIAKQALDKLAKRPGTKKGWLSVFFNAPT